MNDLRFQRDAVRWAWRCELAALKLIINYELVGEYMLLCKKKEGKN